MVSHLQIHQRLAGSGLRTHGKLGTYPSPQEFLLVRARTGKFVILKYPLTNVTYFSLRKKTALYL